jgi:hypothetical protein
MLYQPADCSLSSFHQRAGASTLHTPYFKPFPNHIMQVYDPKCLWLTSTGFVGYPTVHRPSSRAAYQQSPISRPELCVPSNL